MERLNALWRRRLRPCPIRRLDVTRFDARKSLLQFRARDMFVRAPHAVATNRAGSAKNSKVLIAWTFGSPHRLP